MKVVLIILFINSITLFGNKLFSNDSDFQVLYLMGFIETAAILLNNYI